MLPFRRFKRDAYMLDQCATMVEDTVHEIGEYVNKDEDMTDSMTQTLSHLLDVYNDLLDVLDDDELTVNPRLHSDSIHVFAGIFATPVIVVVRLLNS